MTTARGAVMCGDQWERHEGDRSWLRWYTFWWTNWIFFSMHTLFWCLHLYPQFVFQNGSHTGHIRYFWERGMSLYVGYNNSLIRLVLVAWSNRWSLLFDSTLNQGEYFLSLLCLKGEGSRTRVAASACFNSKGQLVKNTKSHIKHLCSTLVVQSMWKLYLVLEFRKAVLIAHDSANLTVSFPYRLSSSYGHSLTTVNLCVSLRSSDFCPTCSQYDPCRPQRTAASVLCTTTQNSEAGEKGGNPLSHYCANKTACSLSLTM